MIYFLATQSASKLRHLNYFLGASSITKSFVKEDINDIDEAMETDSCINTSNQAKDFNINTRLDGDNPANNRNTYLKVHTSQELFETTEETYRIITNLSLREKLVILDDDKALTDT